ncbi:Tim10/DDP family zinc finger-domain-containing protein [Roridomyces roridus]|uniref:Mitochondrial import inner membrane translocase subunit n=1 Tax=Roridomyces roridus TaxID=1738132 RepID=A0AAD7FPH5_9AGAR|nr:Tim10/DDP family zinc finger-domain-containing protein [Roridomyces roridus]
MASLFGGGASSSSSNALNQERLDMALTEMDTVTDLFNRMVSSCQSKCIARYAEAELSKGESVCIDRCVAKYHAVYAAVGEKLKIRGEGQQQR